MVSIRQPSSDTVLFWLHNHTRCKTTDLSLYNDRSAATPDVRLILILSLALWHSSIMWARHPTNPWFRKPIGTSHKSLRTCHSSTVIWTFLTVGRSGLWRYDDAQLVATTDDDNKHSQSMSWVAVIGRCLDTHPSFPLPCTASTLPCRYGSGCRFVGRSPCETISAHGQWTRDLSSQETSIRHRFYVISLRHGCMATVYLQLVHVTCKG